MAGPSSIRRIDGSVPGLLDPSQPERLFRLPGSSFQFASFDPLAATARQDVTNTGELARPKRIVFEITQNGNFWRYVPNARLDEGVKDEGAWPRQIEICGEVVECSQDQWDIYKLDPLYECHVRIPPHLTQITRATDTKTAAELSKRKRPTSPSSAEGSGPLPKRRKRTSPSSNSHAQNDTTRFEAMDVDEPPPTKERVEKRKLADIPESPSTLDDFSRHFFTYTPVQKGKRIRTTSPTALRRKLKSKQLERETLRQKRGHESFVQQQERDDLFTYLMADAAQQIRDCNGQGDTQNEVEVESSQSEEDEEVARRIIIEESRKKLAELEEDKPLWQAAAKQRSIREEAESSSIRVKVTTLHSEEKKRAEAERKERILREEEERSKEDERRQREEASGRERERRRRQQQRWAFGPWTTQRALERYKVLSEEFDSTKFRAELPLTVEAVPWPILTPPARLNIADVSWHAVEKFFSAVKNHMKPEEYKALVEKSHRRFHPDRWQGRSLLKTVLDETERSGMEVAANTVAQALTPLWRAVTGR